MRRADRLFEILTYLRGRGTWTLGAWCELRRDFRNFRLDRLAGLAVCDEEFPDEAGRRFADYMRRMTET
jgi:predicted DNA-binding transcriptional regulator YafY